MDSGSRRSDNTEDVGNHHSTLKGRTRHSVIASRRCHGVMETTVSSAAEHTESLSHGIHGIHGSFGHAKSVCSVYSVAGFFRGLRGPGSSCRFTLFTGVNATIKLPVMVYMIQQLPNGTDLGTLIPALLYQALGDPPRTK